MTTTARELAEEIILNNNKYGTRPVYGQNAIELENAITIAIEQAHQRGRESVLSRVPSEDEIQKESDDHYVTLEGRMIYFDKAFRHGVDFVIAKLKEPT